MFLVAVPAMTQAESRIQRYSQKMLLKNWVFSVCLAEVANRMGDINTSQDADATAGAYFEYGKQSVEVYDTIRPLIQEFVHQHYESSDGAELNTMKCIDLFHSSSLDALTRKLVSNKK